MSRNRPADTTHWKYLEAEWRSTGRNNLPVAFSHLKNMLSAEEYGRMVREYQQCKREVRVENGFIVTCFTP
jgi:hypothetical protein